MNRMRRTLFFSVLLLGGAAAQPSQAQDPSAGDTAVRIVPRDASTRMIYFDPPYAPYLTHDYVSRIDSIVNAVSPSGEVSMLQEPSSETYVRLISAAQVEDFALSDRGRKLLRESREWLIDAGKKQQAGYLKYVAAHVRTANAAMLGDVGEFREALIALFGEANAYDYVGALHVGRTYGAQPRNGIVRSIKTRTVGEGRRDGNLYYPHPDDLDLVSTWSPVVIRSDDDPRIVRGLVTEIEILNPRVDRVLEEVAAAGEREPFNVPRRLVFAKDLQVVEAAGASANVGERVLSLPGHKFEVYAGSLTREPSGTFLLAIEIGRVLQ
ncbi:MAG: hypothetical protein KF849_00850 [Rhizobiaceae bacterium]|nr:hypothetical protein [Rhizobiaceae bacterium]